MRKRGRVSAAAIGVTPVRISAKERPAPPAGLTARERRQWNEITAALRPDWFEAENLPLLAEYDRTASQCTRLARELRNVEVCGPRFAGLSRQDAGDQRPIATGDQAPADDPVINDHANNQAYWRLRAAEAVGALRRTQAARWRAVRLELTRKKSRAGWHQDSRVVGLK